jgi:hypothetical protein
MAIEGDHAPDVTLTHQGDAGTINQAEPSASGRRPEPHRLTVLRFPDPHHIEHVRGFVQDRFGEFKAVPTLEKTGALQQNVVARHQGNFQHPTLLNTRDRRLVVSVFGEDQRI